jgi:hypothetical protein
MGLGASLYLLSLKSYVRLFFALSLLSIPSAIVLSSGDQVDNQSYSGGLAEMFAKATLGNIGYLSSYSC